MKIEINTFNADYPNRQRAIRVIEAIEEITDKCLAKGKKYYQIEDKIVEILDTNEKKK